MNEKIKMIEPVEIWRNFADLNAVPRASKKEERVIQFIKDFGQNLGLETIEDEVGNVIIRKLLPLGWKTEKWSSCRVIWTWCTKKIMTRISILKRKDKHVFRWRLGKSKRNHFGSR
jgi:hypothetical protein